MVFTQTYSTKTIAFHVVIYAFVYNFDSISMLWILASFVTVYNTTWYVKFMSFGLRFLDNPLTSLIYCADS